MYVSDMVSMTMFTDPHIENTPRNSDIFDFFGMTLAGTWTLDPFKVKK